MRQKSAHRRSKWHLAKFSSKKHQKSISVTGRRLSLEPLEDRRLLSIQWDGGPSGTGTSWQDKTNWLGDVLPGATDDVVIGPTFASRTITSTANVTIHKLNSEASFQNHRWDLHCRNYSTG